MADMRHVDTHLMRAACLQPTFDQRCIVQNFTHLIMRDRVLSAALMLGSHFLAIMRRSTDPGIDGAAEGRGAAAYNGIIAPIYAVSGKLSGQTLMRLVCFGDDEQARCVLVDSVEYAGTSHAANAGELPLAMVQIGRESWRDRVCQKVYSSVG